MNNPIDAHVVIESPTYAATRPRLAADPIVKTMAAELWNRRKLAIRAGHTTTRTGCPGQGHIGAVAEAIALVWTQEGTR